jgi:hypothetical protein
MPSRIDVIFLEYLFFLINAILSESFNYFKYN